MQKWNGKRPRSLRFDTEKIDEKNNILGKNWQMYLSDDGGRDDLRVELGERELQADPVQDLLPRERYPKLKQHWLFGTPIKCESTSELIFKNNKENKDI